MCVTIDSVYLPIGLPKHHDRRKYCIVERNDYIEITPELIEKLKIEVMLREDELAIETDKSLEKAGTLNDPDLSEIANEVEDFTMKVETLERMLKRLDAREGGAPPRAGYDELSVNEPGDA